MKRHLLLLEFHVYHIPQAAKPNLPYFERNYKFKLVYASPDNFTRNLKAHVVGSVTRKRDFERFGIGVE